MERAAGQKGEGQSIQEKKEAARARAGGGEMSAPEAGFCKTPKSRRAALLFGWKGRSAT